MIFGRNWKCWIWGHKPDRYVHKRFGRGKARTIAACRRGCGLLEEGD